MADDPPPAAPPGLDTPQQQGRASPGPGMLAAHQAQQHAEALSNLQHVLAAQQQVSAAMGVGGLMAPTMAPPALRRDDSAVAGADPEETAEVRGRTPHVALCLPLDGLLIAS